MHNLPSQQTAQDQFIMSTLAHQEYLDGLPAEWGRVRLGDLGSVYAGSTPRRSESQYWEGSIPWLTPSEVTGRTSKWIHHTEEQISKSGYESTSVHLVPKGSLLVTTRATIGEVAIAAMPITTNQGFKNLVLGSGDDPIFYYYVLRFVADEMKRLASGSTFDEISKSDFTEIVVPRPSLSEQRRIADVLATVDAAIQETDEVIAKQEQVKTGLLQDLLTRGLDAQGRLRDPEKEPEAFRETTDLGKVPAEWDLTTLGEVGIWKSGGTPRRSNPSYWGGETPWLTPKDMKSYRVERTTDYVTSEGLSGTKVAPAGSIFVVVRGMILAHTFPVCVSDRPMAFNQDVKAVIPSAEIASEYLGKWMQAHEGAFLRLVTEATHGTKRFDMSDLYSLSVAVPPREEQRSIVQRLHSQESRVDQEREYKSKLQCLKTGLMQDLLNGRVRVPEAKKRVNDVIA